MTKTFSDRCQHRPLPEPAVRLTHLAHDVLGRIAYLADRLLVPACLPVVNVVSGRL